ncbi:hypothetical protein FH966_10940 [Lentibacillus cibarius]|uniref:HTH cro/C1-type domain-containing protein n=1 Tax=Lentibacillus cibarius TaxID=2583219 RepID=A0A549YJU2_9BACI|nr:hypothetical protein FH966_10940 [Lentibacillus cibarius]
MHQFGSRDSSAVLPACTLIDPDSRRKPVSHIPAKQYVTLIVRRFRQVKNKVKVARVEMELTQQQLAKKVGITLLIR